MEERLINDLEQWRRACASEVPFADRPTGRLDPFAEYDSFGRKQPRRLAIPFWLLTIARLDPGRVRRVPSDAVPEEGTDDEGSFALVTCPCGHRPVVRGELAKCAECERWYVLIELGAVFVTYGAMTPPAVAS